MESRALRLLLLAAMVGILAGCEEENPVFTEFGTVRVAYTDSGLVQQGTKTDPDTTIQGVEWKINEGTARVGDNEIDLLADAGCVYFDSYAALFPGTNDRCGRGIVVTANEPVQVTVDVTFTMQVVKARGFPLPPDEDFDNDGLANVVDNCPLVPNNIDIKNPCAGDWDGDGVPDFVDTCVWVPNAKNQFGPGLPGLVSVGEDCAQIAPVFANGQQVVSLSLGPIDVTQPLRQLNSLTVDLINPQSLTCDWEVGECQLDTSQIEFCAIENVLEIRAGCPRGDG